jgi:hypothetical protein
MLRILSIRRAAIACAVAVALSTAPGARATESGDAKPAAAHKKGKRGHKESRAAEAEQAQQKSESEKAAAEKAAAEKADAERAAAEKAAVDRAAAVTPAPPPPVEKAPVPAVQTATDAATHSSVLNKGIVRKWWFWTGVGVVVAAVAVGVGVGLTQHGTPSFPETGPGASTAALVRF